MSVSSTISKKVAHACVNGNINVIQYIIQYHPDIINTFIYNEWTPLMLASKHGHDNIVNKLIEAGANVNTVNKYGQTALTYASKNGNVNCVRSIIRSSPESINSLTKDYESPLTIAVINDHFEACVELLKVGAKCSLKDIQSHVPMYDFISANRRVEWLVDKMCICMLLKHSLNFLNKDLVRHIWLFL